MDNKPDGGEEMETQMHKMFSGLDKNAILIGSVGLASVLTSIYLYREMKKLKTELRVIKTQEVPEDLMEKVNTNSEDIKSVGLKLDQLISFMAQQEKRRIERKKMLEQRQAQQPQAQQPQQHQVERERDPRDPREPREPREPIESDSGMPETQEMPFMGGRVAPQQHKVIQSSDTITL